MVNKVVKAPRGSPFLSSLGNLTPAWHHYLSNIEGLTTEFTSRLDGQVILDLEARISAMEEVVTAAEERLPKRNWRFFYTDSVGLSNDEGTIFHDLDTRRVLARTLSNDSGKKWTSWTQMSSAQNSVHMFAFGEGIAEGWVLGLYEDLQ